ncbi:hypothetical protein [Agromyces sp. NPDC057865]|uniref:hypothetical protein n=1 Tax=Agromyces sp. NPDC057865 TaxID=3346267 RepID=UPI00366B0536
MTDPRDHAERHGPTEHTPDTGRPEDTEVGQRNAASDLMTDDDQPGPDADQLDADNPVEEDTIETLDPENPPA